MQSNRCFRLATGASLLGFILIGCAPSTTTPPAASKGAAAGSTVAPANEAATTPAEAAPPATEAKPSKVVLGDPSLTAGIPGEGDVTIAQIQTWLDNPENHEVLDFDLPMGLAGAVAQISGVKENPLTRAKIELGRQLYFDPRLSGDATISCASCHHPDDGFARHTQFGEGIRKQLGGRNSPVSYNRIVSGPQFWDGRAESLEDQAVGPIANAIEMGNTHEACVTCVKNVEGYRVQFEKIFPGEGVNIDTIGKALATFERAIVTGPTPYDYYDALKPFRKATQEDIDDWKANDPETYERYTKLTEASKQHPMSESAIRGHDLFFTEKGNCSACHAGANFSDEKYHNLGVGMDKEQPDLGRYEVTMAEADKGAFKTPTIRNVEFTAPYMHDGSQKTLEEVVEWYNKGGHPNQWLDPKVKKLNLSDQDKADLVEFMKACSGEFPKVEMARLPVK